MTKIKPLRDKVLIKPLEAEEKTASGIILPESAKEKSKQGQVIEVGPGKYDDGKLIPPAVKKGDKVIFEEYGGEDIKIDGEEYKLIEEERILAIIE